jgi:hypothetical protein
MLVKAHGVSSSVTLGRTIRRHRTFGMCSEISNAYLSATFTLIIISASQRFLPNVVQFVFYLPSIVARSSFSLQLNPLPTEPLYLVTIRGVNMYLRELSDILDLGLNDPSGNGVVQIQSEAVHYRRTEYATGGMWQVGGNEPWVDREVYVVKPCLLLLPLNSLVRSGKHSSDMCRALGLESFKTVDVYHKTRCYGCVITHVDGWSIVCVYAPPFHIVSSHILTCRCTQVFR